MLLMDFLYVSGPQPGDIESVMGALDSESEEEEEKKPAVFTISRTNLVAKKKSVFESLLSRMKNKPKGPFVIKTKVDTEVKQEPISKPKPAFLVYRPKPKSAKLSAPKSDSGDSYSPKPKSYTTFEAKPKIEKPALDTVASDVGIDSTMPLEPTEPPDGHSLRKLGRVGSRYAPREVYVKDELPCKVCFKMFKTIQALVMHHKSHGIYPQKKYDDDGEIIRKTSDGKSLKVNQCPCCRKIFKHRGAMMNHRKHHSHEELKEALGQDYVLRESPAKVITIVAGETTVSSPSDKACKPLVLEDSDVHTSSSDVNVSPPETVMVDVRDNVSVSLTKTVNVSETQNVGENIDGEKSALSDNVFEDADDVENEMDTGLNDAEMSTEAEDKPDSGQNDSGEDSELLTTKPFVCGLCGAGFSVLGDLGVHMGECGGKVGRQEDDDEEEEEEVEEEGKDKGDNDDDNGEISEAEEMDQMAEEGHVEEGTVMEEEDLADEDEEEHMDFDEDEEGEVQVAITAEDGDKIIGVTEEPTSSLVYANKYKCIICSKNFSSRGTLRDHVREHRDDANQIDKVQCPICQQKFIYSANLMAHMPIHTEEKEWRCSVCSELFSTQVLLGHHLRKHTGEVSKCKICGKVFASPKSWFAHMKRHAGIKTHPHCKICGKRFQRKHTKEVHMVMYHPKEATEMGLSLDLAPAVLPGTPIAAAVAAGDASNAEPGEEIIKVVEESTEARLAFVPSHRMYNYPPSEWEEKGMCYVKGSRKPFKCLSCNKCYIQKASLIIHRRSHTGERPYPCTMCDKRFKEKGVLTKHMIVHMAHEDSSTVVLTDGDELPTVQAQATQSGTDDDDDDDAEIVKVVVDETGQEETMGDQSDEDGPQKLEPTFPSNALKDASGNQIFKCHICYKLFRFRGNLNKHLKIHSGVRGYKCYICGKGFVTSSNLRRHMSVHSDDRPYPCYECDSAFKRKDQLVSHMKAMHNIEYRHSPELLENTDLDEVGKSQMHNFSTVLSAVPSAVESAVQSAVQSAVDRDMFGQLETAVSVKAEPVEQPPVILPSQDNYQTELPDEPAPVESDILPDFQTEIPDMPPTTQSTEALNIQTTPEKEPPSQDVSERRSSLRSPEERRPSFRSLQIKAECVEGDIDNYTDDIPIRTPTKAPPGDSPSKYGGSKPDPERPHACELCEKAFKSSYELKVHYRVHTGERPYKCNLCERAFTQISNLRRHMLMHGSKVSVSCNLCGAVYNTSGDLGRHLTMEHLNTPKYIKSQSDRLSRPPDPKPPRQPLNIKIQPPILKVPKVPKSPVSSPFIVPTTQESQSPVKEADPNQCKVCYLTFTSTYSLAAHMKCHSSETPFTCNICNHQSKGKNYMWQHLRKHMLADSFSCTACEIHFSDKENLDEHMSTHIDADPIKCGDCGKEFVYMAHLRLHQIIHAKQTMGMAKITQRVTAEENKMIKSNQDKEIMDLDEEETASQRTVADPYEDDDDDDDEEEEEEEEGMSSTGSRQHIDTKGVPTNTARQVSYYTSKSMAHKDKDVKPYICKVCGMAVRYYNNLISHMRLHTTDRSQMCPICKKTFAMTTNMKVHMRTHTGEKPHNCTICRRAFAVSGQLRTHMRSHTGERPYVCTKCGQTFIQGGHLTRHIDTYHTSDADKKRYQCRLCGKLYRHSSSVKQHMERDHAGEAATHGEDIDLNDSPSSYSEDIEVAT